MAKVSKKEIEVHLDEKNKVNLLIIKNDKKLVRFSINYSAYIDGKWHAVYRIDTYHGYLHEQRLWLASKPIPLPEYEHMKPRQLFDFCYEKVKEGWMRFRKYYEIKMRDEK